MCSFCSPPTSPGLPNPEEFGTVVVAVQAVVAESLGRRGNGVISGGLLMDLHACQHRSHHIQAHVNIENIILSAESLNSSLLAPKLEASDLCVPRGWDSYFWIGH